MSMQQYERLRGAAWERLLEPETFRAHYNRGHAMNDLGRTHESREALQKAIELNPRYAPALHLLGMIERATGNAPRAIELLRLAAAIDSRNPLVHYDLGLAISQAGRPEDAVRHWEKALLLDPRRKETIYNLAGALQAVDRGGAQKYREQFAALKTEEQDTGRAGTLWNFALAEANRERWDQPFELFRKALDACGNCLAKGQFHKNFGLV